MFYERFQLLYGQLSIVKPFPVHLPHEFKQLLIEQYPEKKVGEDLSPESVRNIRLHRIGNYPVVIKDLTQTGREIVESKGSLLYKSNILRSSPSAQLQIAAEVQKRYREVFGADIPIEVGLGYYIEKETTLRQVIYEYYPHLQFRPRSTEGKALLVAANAEMEKFKRNLQKIQVDPSDGLQYIIVPSCTNRSFAIRFVDTEDWVIDS